MRYVTWTGVFSFLFFLSLSSNAQYEISVADVSELPSIKVHTITATFHEVRIVYEIEACPETRESIIADSFRIPTSIHDVSFFRVVTSSTNCEQKERREGMGQFPKEEFYGSKYIQLNPLLQD